MRSDPAYAAFHAFSSLVGTHQFRCAVNPVIGYELDNRHALPPAAKKTVLVVGGGVSGMQAALTTSQRGHKVILCEKSDRLGGVLCCEEKVPFKRLLIKYLEYQARMISRSPIEMKLRTEVTPEYARAVNADVIIAALGAHPIIPEIPGIGGKNVLGTEEAYYHSEKVGKKVLIIGGGLVGIELGIYLSGLGRTVTIMEMMETLNDGGNNIHGLALKLEIKKYAIQVATSTRALEINDKGVISEYVGSAYTLPLSVTVKAATAALMTKSVGQLIRGDIKEGGQQLYQADTVIYAVGQQPLHEEAEALQFCAPEFHQIGDCLAAKNIQQATALAFDIARDI